MREDRSMDWTRIENLHEAYGADPDRWPEAERAPALTLMASDPSRAAALRYAAAGLDAALDSWTAPPLADAAAAAMASAARPGFGSRIRRATTEWLGWSGPLWQPAGAFAAALVLGLALGGAVPDPRQILSADVAAAGAATANDLENLILDFEGLIGEDDLS